MSERVHDERGGTPEPHAPSAGERDPWLYLVTHWFDPDLSLTPGGQTRGLGNHSGVPGF